MLKAALNLATIASVLQTATRASRVEAAAQARLEAEAERLAEAIRDAAPEDTGHLRASVRVEPAEEPLKVFVRAGGTPETQKPARTGVTYDEAVMAEYGTRHAPAQPFFWPTVNAMRDGIKANLDADLTEGNQP